MEAKDNPLKSNLEEMTHARQQMRDLIVDYFSMGGYKNQLNLLSSAIYNIVEKGSGEDNSSLDNEFAYTNRYIRESVYELTELQRFLISLNESYLHYRKCNENMYSQNNGQWNILSLKNKAID